MLLCDFDEDTIMLDYGVCRSQMGDEENASPALAAFKAHCAAYAIAANRSDEVGTFAAPKTALPCRIATSMLVPPTSTPMRRAAISTGLPDQPSIVLNCSRLPTATVLARSVTSIGVWVTL